MSASTTPGPSVYEPLLRVAGCEALRVEKVMGTTHGGRLELSTFLDFLRAGVTLVVTRVDRPVGDLPTYLLTY